MTKRDLLEARQRACRDRGLSHGAARLFCVLVDAQYFGLVYPDEDEWEAAGSTIEEWLGCGRNQANAYRAELLAANYIRYRRLRGCPPTHVFSFVHSPRKGAIDRPESGTSKAPKEGNHSPRNGDALTKSPLKGKRDDKKVGGESAPPKVAPVSPKPKRPWWHTPPQFEELDRKVFPRERKALGKEMVEWLTAERERLKVEFSGAASYKDWPEAARATYEVLGERRTAVKEWIHGVRR